MTSRRFTSPLKEQLARFPAVRRKTRRRRRTLCRRLRSSPTSPPCGSPSPPTNSTTPCRKLTEAGGSHLEFLHRLLADQAGLRRRRRIERLIKDAHFREALPLDTFDWNFNPAIPRLEDQGAR